MIRKDDSALVQKLLDIRGKVLKSIRETVAADRLSKRHAASGCSGIRWTNAAQRRDAELASLKELLEKCAKDL